jgi:hypothetical protein
MIVGFQGRKRSGKNEAAHRLAQLAAPVGWDVQFKSFAGPMKDTLCDLFGCDRERLDELKEDEAQTFELPGCEPMNVRTLMQTFGESARRRFGHDLWLDLCLPPGFAHDDKLVLVTDVRPDYEVRRVQELGGVVVRLEGGDPFDGHSTEVMGGDPDYFIDNTKRDPSVLDAQLVRFWWWLACGAPRVAGRLVTG